MDSVGNRNPTTGRSVHLGVAQASPVKEDGSNQGEGEEEKVADCEMDENDGSFETISICSPQASDDKVATGAEAKKAGFLTWSRSKRSDSNGLQNMKVDDMDEAARTGVEGETIAVQNSEEQGQKQKAGEGQRYRKLMHILVLVIGLIFIMDLVLLILLLKK